MDGCGRGYSRLDSLNNHLKVAHGVDTSRKNSRFACPLGTCSQKFFHATQLISHLREHKIHVGRFNGVGVFLSTVDKFVQISDTQNHVFPDMKTFLKWKEEEEKATFTCYTKPKGSTQNDKGKHKF